MHLDMARFSDGSNSLTSWSQGCVLWDMFIGPLDPKKGDKGPGPQIDAALFGLPQVQST